jgi:hypothetical protein
MSLTRPRYSQIYDSDFKNSARVATTQNITLAGAAPLVVDDVTLSVGDRVLVRAQNTASQNGIYRVNVAGTGNNGSWGRALDADTATKLSPGTSLSIEEGTTQAGKLYRMTSTNPITLGSTAITWTDVSGGGGGSAGGNNGQIQYNDTNTFGGATYLWYNETTGTITANGGVASSTTSTGTIVVAGGVGISGELNVGANVTVTGNVLPSANVTYNLGSPSQRWKDLYLSGTTINLNGATISAANGSITFQNSLGGSFAVTGSAGGQSTGTFGNLVANSGVASSSTTTGALIIGGGAGISGALNVGGDVTITGGLTVNGTTTNINTTNLVIEDKNIVLADVTTPTNTTADGAGITIKGATDKTFNWVNATTAWTSSEDLNLLTGKQYEIAGNSVLTATTLGSGVVNSSLTGLGIITSLVATTAVATNFSTANAVITGGSLNNTTIGATTHTTGRFTTVTATTVNAGTIGNSGATLTGTLSTASQTNVTAVGTLAGLQVNTTTIAPSSISGAALGTISDATTGWSAPGIGFGSGTGGHGGIVYGSGQMYFGSENGSASGTMATRMTLTNTGVLTVYNNILPSANLSYNIGSTSAWFNTIYGVSTQAKYADLAEHYVADADYEPGTVVVFGGEHEITISTESHDTRVAGVISTNPAYLMNAATAGLPVALQGRVPCRVQGPVKKGDVLVASNIPGVAQRIGFNWQPGCVIGKALDSINTNTIETIEVVVGRF